jgi:hypothetical protein
MPSKTEWEAHIKEFKLKSISLSEYSKINSLPFRALCYWFRKDNKEASLKKRQLRESQTRFLPLKISNVEKSMLQITVNHIGLLIDEDFNLKFLKQAILILKEC